MTKELKFLLYNTPQENIKIDVVVKEETLWLTQKAMAALFGTSRENITIHLKSTTIGKRRMAQRCGFDAFK